MKNQNTSFQQFIEKLKTIDVGELLDKAKGIKVDDIKSMQFSDIKTITKSTYFYPSLGIIFASITSIFFFFPSLQSLKNRQSKSLQYNTENQELPFINEELIRRKESMNKFEKIFQNFTGMVAKKGDLVLIPEILYDSSQRSGVEIVEFAPITNDDLTSCSSAPQEDLFNNNFEENFSDDTFNDFNDIPQDDQFNDYGSEITDSKIQLYEFIINEEEGIKEFEAHKKSISDIFESNYYVVNIRSNYLDSLKFLKNLQEYKMTILPYCYEPQMKANNFSSIETNINTSLNGDIDARIILNVPNYKVR